MSFGGIFDWDEKSRRLSEVNAELEDPAVWNDPKRAQELGKEKKALENVVLTISELQTGLTDNAELFEMSKADNDIDGIEAIAADVAAQASRVGDLEFRRMFNKPADPLPAFVDIQAGAGGTEACDWANMLLRQYVRYAERKGFTATVEDITDGDTAGIKSATIKVDGEYAFGLLRTETGVHRLVRKSPFDSSGGRHTSFASVFVYPEIDDSIEIEINPSDVRTDTFRASGAGGQHINKTSSKSTLTITTSEVTGPDLAVERVRSLLPAEIRITSQKSRSQWRNRQLCMSQLREMLDTAAMPPAPPRRKSRPTRGSVERRLDSKRRESQKKESRRTDNW